MEVILGVIQSENSVRNVLLAWDVIEFMLVKRFSSLAELRDAEQIDLLNLEWEMLEIFNQRSGIDIFYDCLNKFDNSDLRTKFSYFETKYFMFEPEDYNNF